MLETRPPARWHCALTPPLRSTSHPSKRSSPTPASSMRRCQTSRLSPYNTGSPQGPLSRRSQKISRRRATLSFILLPFRHNRRGNFYIQTNPSQTRSPQDTLRRILPISLPLIFQCQHHQHWQPLQVTIPRQTRLSTPLRRSLC